MKNWFKKWKWLRTENKRKRPRAQNMKNKPFFCLTKNSNGLSVCRKQNGILYLHIAQLQQYLQSFRPCFKNTLVELDDMCVSNNMKEKCFYSLSMRCNAWQWNFRNISTKCQKSEAPAETERERKNEQLWHASKNGTNPNGCSSVEDNCNFSIHNLNLNTAIFFVLSDCVFSLSHSISIACVHLSILNLHSCNLINVRFEKPNTLVSSRAIRISKFYLSHSLSLSAHTKFK